MTDASQPSDKPTASQLMPEATLLHPRDILGKYAKEYEDAYEAIKNGAARGPILKSMPMLGDAIGGFLPPGLSVLHGQPGCGKTALANQWAAEVGCPALIVSLEMTFTELMSRHASRFTKEWIDKFRGHDIEPARWKSIMEDTVKKLPLMRIVDATSGHITVQSLRDMAIATRGDAKHLLIVIDSMHAWARRAQGVKTQFDTLGALITSFTALASELKASVLCISEQNRQSRGSSGQDASSGNGGIEYTGELVMALTKESNELDSVGEKTIKLTVAKNRHGDEDAQFEFRFNGRTMKFTEHAELGFASRNGKSKAKAY